MAFEYVNAETGDILDILDQRDNLTIKNHFIPSYSLADRQIDGTKTSLKVIPYAIELAKLYGDEIQLLNIQQSLKELGLPIIKRVGELLKDCGVSFSVKIRFGIAAMEIDTESSNTDVRYVLMSIGKGKEEAIGSLNKHVLKLATCPVLLIPEHA